MAVRGYSIYNTFSNLVDQLFRLMIDSGDTGIALAFVRKDLGLHKVKTAPDFVLGSLIEDTHQDIYRLPCIVHKPKEKKKKKKT